ncbi:LacI family DNA-binding transcriptional regulator [Micromonospora psammae]|uniref:LacI family DNA-binding transcriptional regulator n=1 Tax=Micromonospora sp. CPCC 205556 TaxID=3122398 RepID=UPI002FF3B4CA
MGATLRDVARLADVSVKTVSNVVNGYPHVSAALRHRVQAAVEELGYRPNAAARHLRTGRSGMLALVVSAIDLPYADELAREVTDAAAQRGYRVSVEQVAVDPEPSPAGSARPTPVDGVLLGAAAPAPGLIEARAAAGTPVVLLGESGDGRCDHVAIDHTRAARDATEHLLTSGRRDIAAIGAHPRRSAASPQPRTAGYRAAMRRAGLAPPPGYLQPARRHRRADGYRAARELLDHRRRPDALFCFSDLLAIGAMRAVFDAGLSVPDDLAVIGVGDLEEGRYSRPALSTVSADTAFIAREAIDRIVARISHPDAAVVQVTAPHAVLARESCGVTALPRAGRGGPGRGGRG